MWFLFLFTSTFTSTIAFAQAPTESPIVVRDQYEGETVSGSAWESRGGQVERVLRGPGFSFAAHGGPGQTRTVFLRGARAEDTLVLLDGIPLNDPSSTSRAFDFSQLPSTFERVEILKGPQSVLYGGDAMGGVIHFHSARRPSSKIFAEGGSYGTFRARGEHLGFHAGYETSQGFSAADSRQGNSERDAHRSWNFGGAKEFVLDSRTTCRAQGLFHRAQTDTDFTGGYGGDKTGTFTRNSQLLFRAEAFHLTEDEYEWTTAGSLFSREREDNTFAPAYYRSTFWKAESRVRRQFGAHTPTLGVEYQEEAGRSSEGPSRKKTWTGGAFAHDLYKHGAWEGNVGGRLDVFGDFGNALSFGGGMGYWLVPERWKLAAKIGSGHKTPSLYQRYSTYGDVSLKPSRSLGGDAGVVFTKDAWRAELTYFANHFRQLVDYDKVRLRYYNIGRAITEGVEAQGVWDSGSWRVANAFTLLRAVDKTTGLRLVRRPTLADNLEVGYREGDRWNATLIGRYVGRREDQHPSRDERQPMPAFFTLGLEGGYRLAPGWRALVRGENLLDRHYQETAGFGTAGRSGYLGVEAEL